MTERRMQKAVLRGLHLSGMRHLFGRIAGGHGAILTFHRVRDPVPSETGFAPNSHLEVTPKFLGELIDWARAHDLDLITLDEAKRRLARPADRRFLVITMDDGYRDNLQNALPVLKQRNCPFTVYVATGFIDRAANPWWMVLEAVVAMQTSLPHPAGSGEVFDLTSKRGKAHAFSQLAEWLQSVSEVRQREEADRLATENGIDVSTLLAEAFMDWTEVAAMAAEPLVTIGAHTNGHYALAKLSREDALADIKRGADRLEEMLGKRPRHFAYPYGFPAAVGPREHKLAAELGFSTAVLTTAGVLRSDHLASPTTWPRISMNGHFQSVRWADILISGVPFLPGRVAGRVLGRGGQREANATASASSG